MYNLYFANEILNNFKLYAKEKNFRSNAEIGIKIMKKLTK